LVDKFPRLDLRFQIVGDGPLRTELESIAHSKRLSPNVLRFCGELQELADLYRSSDILVLTSEYEGVPNVILEAMSHSLAVVATRVGAVEEILNEGNGILVEPGDMDGLIDAVSLLILDKQRRQQCGQRGREFVIQNHSITGLSDRLMSIYTGLVN
jgi:glycosyltransferase involved in cell wall biosynthesis